MKKGLFFGLFFAVLLIGCSTEKNTKYLVGTYTETSNQGINIIQFNKKTKVVSLLQVVEGIDNPSFVISNKAKTVIVAVEETASVKGGKVTSYSYADSRI